MIKYYRLKNYLNASHFVVFNGRKGNVHPHTWEFSALLVSCTEEVTKFTDTERKISAIFEPYQNKVLNDVAPFDSINPSLENMTEYFIGRIEKAVEGFGYKLVEVEGSETPVRTFGVRIDDSMPSNEKKDSYSDDCKNENGADVEDAEAEDNDVYEDDDDNSDDASDDDDADPNRYMYEDDDFIDDIYDTDMDNYSQSNIDMDNYSKSNTKRPDDELSDKVDVITDKILDSLISKIYDRMSSIFVGKVNNRKPSNLKNGEKDRKKFNNEKYKRINKSKVISNKRTGLDNYTNKNVKRNIVKSESRINRHRRNSNVDVKKLIDKLEKL
jgi:hypothetical protein